MKPIRLTQPFKDLPEGLTFQPVHVGAWVASYEGRTIKVLAEEWDEGVWGEYFTYTDNEGKTTTNK